MTEKYIHISKTDQKTPQTKEQNDLMSTNGKQFLSKSCSCQSMQMWSQRKKAIFQQKNKETNPLWSKQF